MTEHEWAACQQVGAMLQHARNQISPRKQRLFVVACGRRVVDLFHDQRLCAALEAGEQFADGNLTKAELLRAQRAAFDVRAYGPNYNPSQVALSAVNPALRWMTLGLCCSWAARARAQASGALDGGARRDAMNQEYSAHGDLLRDIVGPLLFRPVVMSEAVRCWEDGIVRRLAEGIYRERAYDRLPILADALLDAGCDEGEAQAHCRGGGPHVRGCWVPDLILGKA